MKNKMKTRYGNLYLPRSVNASVVALKRLSRQVKQELYRSIGPTDRLKETYNDINLTLQRIRQTEANYVSVSNHELNQGRKQYQYSVIQQDKVKAWPNSVVVSRETMKRLYRIDQGVSIRELDRFQHLDTQGFVDYVVRGVGYDKDGHVQVTLAPIFKNNYVRNVDHRHRVVGLPELTSTYYLVDVYFDDYDYTPNYCEECDTWHDAWANDGALND